MCCNVINFTDVQCSGEQTGIEQRAKQRALAADKKNHIKNNRRKLSFENERIRRTKRETYSAGHKVEISPNRIENVIIKSQMRFYKNTRRRRRTSPVCEFIPVLRH